MVVIGQKCGYIDTTGKTVIAPQFDYASRFAEGLAAVKVREKWGYIDTTGKTVIAPQFDEADRFEDGLAGVKIGEKYGYMDTTGKTVIAPQFDEADRFEDGLAGVKIGEKYGYMDTTGKTVIAPQFDYAGSFAEGLAWVRVSEKWGYIDKTGRIVAMTDTRYSADVIVNGEGDVLYCSNPDVLKQIEAEKQQQQELEQQLPMIKSVGTANELYVMGYKFEKTNPQVAIAAYQEILDRFPDADAAIKAVERLDIVSSGVTSSTNAPAKFGHVQAQVAITTLGAAVAFFDTRTGDLWFYDLDSMKKQQLRLIELGGELIQIK